jgi:hypothetical protein
MCGVGVACAEAQPTAAGPIGTAASQATMQAEFEREFQLHNSETATIGREGLMLRFDRVTRDDRCPVGSRCEAEGDAIVEVTLWQPSADAATFDLHTDASLRTEARYLRYAVRLARLDPRPVGEQPVPLPNYAGTFVVVTKAPQP